MVFHLEEMKVEGNGFRFKHKIINKFYTIGDFIFYFQTINFVQFFLLQIENKCEKTEENKFYANKQEI